MKDRLPLITIVVMVMVFIGSVVTVVLVQNSSFSQKSADLTTKISNAQKQADTISDSKDTNNFTPEEMVKAFLAEVKSDAIEKQKLYLMSTVQTMDVKNTLKLGSDLSNMIIGESEQTITDEGATVNINVEVNSEQVARTFSLSKEDGAWKINGITAE